MVCGSLDFYELTYSSLAHCISPEANSKNLKKYSKFPSWEKEEASVRKRKHLGGKIFFGRWSSFSSKSTVPKSDP